MEHSEEYNRILKERRKRERIRRQKVEKVILGCGLTVIGLSLVMLLLGVLIKKEHKRAVTQYNEDNWVTVEKSSEGRLITGKDDGNEYSYFDNGTYFDGISVDGVDISGMTYSEAREAMKRVVEDKLNSINMVVTVGDASLTLTARDFDIEVNVNDILGKAYSLGRESLNDYAANYRKQQQLLENPIDYHISYSCDRVRIEQRVADIADFVNTKPKEPYVTVSQRLSANSDQVSASDDNLVVRDTDTIVETVYAANGKAIAYICYNPGKNGFTLNQEAMVDRIFSAFEAGNYDCVLKADLEDTAPEKTPADIKGSVKLISAYTSEFDASKENRSRNVQKGAGILNACVVKPGKEISFNKYIGPRTEAGGWLRAPGITNGKEYADSPGGGICQVSGTLYNALLQCGPAKIKITQRHHHSWPSTYVPYGLDATVDTNGPDLKWKNISKENIYIFAYADLKKGVMYVYIYGTPEADGSYYETYAETVREIEPDPPKEVYNQLWPEGYTRETITARVGYEAKAYLKHFDKDGVLIDTLYIHTDYYSPVQGEIMVGTGDPSLPIPPRGSK